MTPSRSTAWAGLAVVALVSSWLPWPAYGDQRPVPLPELRGASLPERVEAAFAAMDGLGLHVVVLVAPDNGPALARAFGDAAVPGVAPGDVQVDLNSITKTVTAAVVLDAVEGGALSLDATLGALLPDVPEDKAGITVRQLLTHTAGLPGAIGSDEEVIDRETYLARAMATPLEALPGEEYGYSNVGYSLLAALVEVATGQPYEDRLAALLAAEGLPPMGYDAVLDDARALRTADGGTIRERSWGGHPPSWHLTGNGGLVATPAAFVAFEAAFRDGRLVGDALAAEAYAPQVAEGPEGASHHGFGLVVEDREDVGRIFWHDGGNDVFSAVWVRADDLGLTIFAAGGYAYDGEAFLAAEVLGRFLAPAP